MAYYLFNFTRRNAAKDRTLREQAVELLRVGLWGIGAKTPNRELLRPGDQVLAFVGAPEQEFVGRAVLSSGVHNWDQAEAQRYPGLWASGVAFADVEVWEHPVAMQSVWHNTGAAAKNARGMFMAGVVAVRGEDFDLIVASRTPGEEGQALTKGAATAAVRPAPSRAVPQTQSAPALVDRLYAESEHLKAYLAAAGSQPTTEAATRALLINKQLEALGYDDFGDLEFDAPVDSGDFTDYILNADGRRVAVVEAKKLGSSLGAKDAAQVVKYASVLGVRWGILTDGRRIRLYDGVGVVTERFPTLRSRLSVP